MNEHTGKKGWQMRYAENHLVNKAQRYAIKLKLLIWEYIMLGKSYMNFNSLDEKRTKYMTAL
jgi:hypothetical protein